MGDEDLALQLIEQVKQYAELAVHFDTDGKKAAAFYYLEAANLIDSGIAGTPYDNASFKQKSAEYRKRAAELYSREERHKGALDADRNHSVSNPEAQRACFLFSEALKADENGGEDEKGDAVDLYLEAVELCLKAKDKVKGDSGDLHTKLTKVATQALDRAEQLKSAASPSKKGAPAVSGLGASSGLVRSSSGPATSAAPSLGIEGLGLHDGSKQFGKRQGYTKEEKEVLAKTSMINGREYVPFMSVDLGERFAFTLPFTDRHGKLALSAKQSSKLVRWARPDEFMRDPTVLDGQRRPDCFCVKQTVVSDCSFVASIAISAQHEKKFGGRLVTSLIYPQDRAGNPVYNPCGKYMVRLRINGVSRKVIVDDLFPLGPGGEPLCSYSSNRNELWVSLLEKAYMKVMGGYDFPGSNSNIDLYALTGWVPERATIKAPNFDKDELFRKLWQRFHRGDVLITVATGEMSEAEADRAGLVPTHAYALLDIREVKGTRLFLLKNPWSHLRWKGNYSELDSRHWTPEMQTALSYDPKNAQHFDNGVFWIDYDSLCRFFDVFYMNWNPGLFKHTYAIHDSWKAGVGPAKDMYSISANPQFSLEIKGPPGPGAVWVLLSRHITDIEDFKNNREYITVLVYKAPPGRCQQGAAASRVFYPFDPPPFIDGVRINSPHYLCKIDLNENMPRKLVLVVSQYEKTATIFYTLRVFSTAEFELAKIGSAYRFRQEITDQWKGRSAGGCANNPDTYVHNPRHRLILDKDSELLVEMKGPKQYQIGFDIITIDVAIGSSEACKQSSKYFKRKQSGPYRSGYVALEVSLLAGSYDLVPTTFRAGQESAFFLTLQSTSPVKVSKVQ